jgi:hypothetical protein
VNILPFRWLPKNRSFVHRPPTTHELWVGGWKDEGPASTHTTGLRRFIGTAEVPLAGELPELPYVDTLVCDAQGNLWVGAGGVVYRFDGEAWTDFPFPPEAQTEVIQALAVDQDSTLWCSTTAGLWRYEQQWIKELLDESVQALAVTNKEVWAGTPVGLKRVAGTSKREWANVASIPEASVTVLTVAQNGVIWAGTQRGLVKLVNGEVRIFSANNTGVANDSVQSLALHRNTLWVGMVNGLSRFVTTN